MIFKKKKKKEKNVIFRPSTKEKEKEKKDKIVHVSFLANSSFHFFMTPFMTYSDCLHTAYMHINVLGKFDEVENDDEDKIERFSKWNALLSFISYINK